MSEITFEERSYQTFKEFPSKARPVAQNVLSTIEFGFTPYVPFSEEYIMYHDTIGETGFGVRASSPDTTSEWAGRLNTYGLNRVIEDVDRAPAGQIESEAVELSRRITLMLEQENIAKEHQTTTREEVEGRAMAKIALEDLGPQGIWRDPRVNEQINLVTGAMAGLGKGFDLYASTQSEADILEYNLHMIARQLGSRGEIFIRGVRAMETTTETRKKYFQGLMRDNAQAGVDVATNWSDSVNLGVEQLKGLIRDNLSIPFKAVYAKIGEQSEDGDETLEYFARQLLARFAEIEAGQAYGSQFGEAYIFAAPVTPGGHQMGLARIEPVIDSDGYLTQVLVDTAVLGGESFKALQERIGPAAFEKFANTSYMGNAQLLLWDYQQMTQASDTEILAMAAEAYAPTVNEIALRSGRGKMLGDSLRTEMEVGLGNTVMSSARVQAVEVIGSREATDIVEKQIKAFFIDPSISTQFEKFYKEAMAGSEDLTGTWKGQINVGAAQTVSGGGVYADAERLFTNQENLAGIGIPFWFLIGRDPTGYKKFKAPGRETKTKAEFTATNVLSAKELARGKEPGVRHEAAGWAGPAGTYSATRDPRDYYITRTTTSTGRRTGYMAEPWRAALGVPFGKAGVMAESETTLEEILSRSRVGRVPLRQDGQPDMRYKINR